jgi:hypothetical protein
MAKACCRRGPRVAAPWPETTAADVLLTAIFRPTATAPVEGVNPGLHG